MQGITAVCQGFTAVCLTVSSSKVFPPVNLKTKNGRLSSKCKLILNPIKAGGSESMSNALFRYGTLLIYLLSRLCKINVQQIFFDLTKSVLRQNLKNLSRGLNLSGGSNMVGST